MAPCLQVELCCDGFRRIMHCGPILGTMGSTLEAGIDILLMHICGIRP